MTALTMSGKSSPGDKSCQGCEAECECGIFAEHEVESRSESVFEFEQKPEIRVLKQFGFVHMHAVLHAVVGQGANIVPVCKPVHGHFSDLDKLSIAQLHRRCGMTDVLVVDPRSHQLPMHPHLPPALWLSEILQHMTEISRKTPERRVVWNFSENNLSFDHAKFMALWLQVPDTNLKLYALDLSFNCICVPDWASFAPLVGVLAKNVQYMHFGGNPLPALVEDPSLQTPDFERVSLGLAELPLAQNAWVDSWTTKARCFQQQAYGHLSHDTRYHAGTLAVAAICCTFYNLSPLMMLPDTCTGQMQINDTHV